MPPTPVEVTLDPMTRSLALAVLAGRVPEGDRWAADYPVPDERDAIRHLLARRDADAPGPFALYVVRTAADGVAIGGAGFFGPPGEDGTVELGYGIVPSMRRRGAATAAVRALLRIAAEHGATTVRADTTLDNVASLRVLEKAGLRAVGRDGELVLFETALGAAGGERGR